MISTESLSLAKERVDQKVTTESQTGVIVSLFIKRCIDIVFSSIMLIMLLPLFLLIGICIKFTSKGPVFFKQKRVRKNGKLFQIVKFRTMVHFTAAEDHKAYIKHLLKEGSHSKENKTKLLNEYMEYVHGKVTRIGKYLRRSSFDELPQLYNILRGEMSLVGPRPHPTYEVKEYKDWYHRRHDVKPGLTGWSKLNLRLTPKNYEEAIKFDLWYVDHWSIFLDIKILFLTIPFILSRTDAH